MTDAEKIAKLESQMAKMVWRTTYEHVIDQRDELQGLLREISSGVRDILWCALVWNDHNFTERDLLDRVTRAAKSMGLDRYKGVDAVNHWMARVDKALGSTSAKGEKP